MIPGVRRAFYWMSPLPLISLAGVLIYLNGLEGWGAWAGGVLVVIPMTLSLVVAAFGGVLIYRAKKAGDASCGLWWATLLAGSVDLWFAFTLALEEVRRSFF
jgi:hypothetical protein